jgi:hypothetical protein
LLTSFRSLELLEDLPHPVQLADAVELGDTAQVAVTVEPDAQVDQTAIIPLVGAVLKEQFGLR